MEMITATEIAKLEGWKGDARIYELSDTAVFTDEVREWHLGWVIVSAAIVPFSGPETFIFSADEESLKTGSPISWAELPGSFKGALDHQAALEEFLEYVNQYQEED